MASLYDYYNENKIECARSISILEGEIHDLDPHEMGYVINLALKIENDALLVAQFIDGLYVVPEWQEQKKRMLEIIRQLLPHYDAGILPQDTLVLVNRN